jgi:hypothetical protein
VLLPSGVYCLCSRVPKTNLSSTREQRPQTVIFYSPLLTRAVSSRAREKACYASQRLLYVSNVLVKIEHMDHVLGLLASYHSRLALDDGHCFLVGKGKLLVYLEEGEKENTMAKIVERTRARHEVRQVDLGKVYRWGVPEASWSSASAVKTWALRPLRIPTTRSAGRIIALPSKKRWEHATRRRMRTRFTNPGIHRALATRPRGGFSRTTSARCPRTTRPLARQKACIWKAKERLSLSANRRQVTFSETQRQASKIRGSSGGPEGIPERRGAPLKLL